MLLLPLLVAPSARARPLDEVVDLVAAGDATCALRTDGDLYCWGDPYGPYAVRVAQDVAAVAEPGLWVTRGGVVTRRTPEGAWEATGFRDVRQLVRWGEAVCASATDGRLWCAGTWSYAFGGPRNVDRTAATPVPDAAGVVELSTTEPAFRRADGSVRRLTPRGPEVVPGLPKAVELAGSCIRTARSEVWCWTSATGKPLEVRRVLDSDGGLVDGPVGAYGSYPGAVWVRSRKGLEVARAEQA